MELVYGGGGVGLMEVVADEALAAGAKVIGVIPQSLVDREVAHRGLDDLRVVDTMHQRKAMMYELSDAVVALPGGLGTLEELFEALTWNQLGIQRKPCGLLNTAGYYDDLLRFLDRSVDDRFVSAASRETILADESPAALLDRLAECEIPDADTLLDRKPVSQ